KEIEILKELYRITRRYLLLFEPIYEKANNEGKARMAQHGYIKGLYDIAVGLGYNVVEYEMLNNPSNSFNPTGIIIIEKTFMEKESDGVFCDPVSKADIIMQDDSAYCGNSMLMYPIIRGVPCLIEDYAILATKYNDFQ
ncbi:MAG: hypothetical protein HFH61_05315, partial [Lachnospiraceae bacterium]|nr:hypothetical protein [Lachnospiraceae bacterium]